MVRPDLREKRMGELGRRASKRLRLVLRQSLSVEERAEARRVGGRGRSRAHGEVDWEGDGERMKRSGMRRRGMVAKHVLRKAGGFHRPPKT